MDKLRQPNPPDLTDTLEENKRDIQMAINCVQIGKIIEFFPSEGPHATVQIDMKQVKSIDPVTGVKTLEEYPLIFKVPVVTLYGGISFLSMPVQEGDSCLLFFNDRQTDNWFNSGGGQFPTLSRVHDMSDAIAIVGIRSLNNAIAGYLTNGVRLAFDDATHIDLTEGLADVFATLFVHHGNVKITGSLDIVGDMYGDQTGTGELHLRSNIVQEAGKTIHVGDGATGTFNTVTVVDGIVKGGS